MTSSGMPMMGGGPMPVSSSGMSMSTGHSSPHGSSHGSGPGTPTHVPMGPSSHPGQVPMGPSSHPGMGGQSPHGHGQGGPSPGHPSMGGPSPNHPGMGGPHQSPGHHMNHPSPGHPGMGGPSPLSMSSEKIYPADQPMVFNPQNPNAPPIYPCGICHKEVHDNDQVRPVQTSHW